MTTNFSSPRTRAGLAGLVGCALFAVALHFRPQDVLLYNDSTSIPPGLYLRTQRPIERGSIVTVRATDVASTYAALRQFSDPDDRFIKRVAAHDGDIVCAQGVTLTINGAHVATRFVQDSAGRSLPTWTGCQRLSPHQVLLLGDAADSFDGRYWGPISTELVEGVWRPLSTP